MGVKTLDPSDYALVSSVTTHLSGVQLLPTVCRRGGSEATAPVLGVTGRGITALGGTLRRTVQDQIRRNAYQLPLHPHLRDHFLTRCSPTSALVWLNPSTQLEVRY